MERIHTNNNGKFPLCVCLLSRFPYFSLFEHVLQYAEARLLISPDTLPPLLKALLSHPHPLSGTAETEKEQDKQREEKSKESLMREQKSEVNYPPVYEANKFCVWFRIIVMEFLSIGSAIIVLIWELFLRGCSFLLCVLPLLFTYCSHHFMQASNSLLL